MQKHSGLLRDILHSAWPQTGVADRPIGLSLGVASALPAETRHTSLLTVIAL